MLSTKFKILFVLIFFFFIAIISQKYSLIKIGDIVFIVEIAKTEAQKTKGPSNRDSLENNRGMLFVFDEPGFYNPIVYSPPELKQHSNILQNVRML